MNPRRDAGSDVNDKLMVTFLAESGVRDSGVCRLEPLPFYAGKTKSKRRALAVGLCLGLTSVSQVSAQEPRRMALAVQSACPTRALLIEELTPLLRGYQVIEAPAALAARVDDFGESYRVSVGSVVRELSDPGRQCLERARVAAVFLALNLPTQTPAAAAPRTATAVTNPDQRVPNATSRAPRSRDIAVDLRLFAQAETAWGASVASTGIGAGASLQRRWLAITLLGSATTSTTPYQADGEAPRFELQRFPFAALLGWEATLGMLEWGAGVGPALDVLRFRGKAVPNPDSALRVNPGVRLNAALRVRGGRHLAAELAPGIAWFPRTYAVRVEPAEMLAETPRWWVGVALGLNYEIWGG